MALKSYFRYGDIFKGVFITHFILRYFYTKTLFIKFAIAGFGLAIAYLCRLK